MLSIGIWNSNDHQYDKNKKELKYRFPLIFDRSLIVIAKIAVVPFSRVEKRINNVMVPNAPFISSLNAKFCNPVKTQT